MCTSISSYYWHHNTDIRYVSRLQNHQQKKHCLLPNPSTILQVIMSNTMTMVTLTNSGNTNIFVKHFLVIKKHWWHRHGKAKVLAERSNIVCQKFEIERPETMLFYFCLKCFAWIFSKASNNEPCWSMIVWQCFVAWPNDQTLFDKQSSNVSEIMFNRKSRVFQRQCLIGKVKCFRDNAWW